MRTKSDLLKIKVFKMHPIMDEVGTNVSHSSRNTILIAFFTSKQYKVHLVQNETTRILVRKYGHSTLWYCMSSLCRLYVVSMSSLCRLYYSMFHPGSIIMCYVQYFPCQNVLCPLSPYQIFKNIIFLNFTLFKKGDKMAESTVPSGNKFILLC